MTRTSFCHHSDDMLECSPFLEKIYSPSIEKPEFLMFLSPALHRNAPKRSRSDANQCLQFIAALAISDLAPNFKDTTGLSILNWRLCFPMWVTTLASVSHSVPTVLEESGNFFLYLRCSPGAPSKSILYMPHSPHFKSGHHR